MEANVKHHEVSPTVKWSVSVDFGTFVDYNFQTKDLIISKFEIMIQNMRNNLFLSIKRAI